MRSETSHETTVVPSGQRHRIHLLAKGPRRCQKIS